MNQSTSSENRRVIRIVKPNTKPTIRPSAKPAKQIAKPAKPVAKPAKPIAKPAKPVAKPVVKPVVTSVVKPIKTSSVVTANPLIKRALLIGINYAGTSSALNGCINDVINVKNELLKYRRFIESNIVVMTDDVNGPLKPTKNNIITQMRRLVAMTDSNDELYVHFSGHGTQVKSINNDEALNVDTPNMDDAICPCDYTSAGLIIDDDLRKILVEKMPRGSKLRAMFDCCHSGSSLDLPYMYKIADVIHKVQPELPGCNDCILISGCKSSQTAADAYISGSYTGALTWAVLKAYKSSRNVPTSWKNFLLIIRHYLADGDYTQIPMLSMGSETNMKLNVDI
jgi:hypothetical protein